MIVFQYEINVNHFLVILVNSSELKHLGIFQFKNYYYNRLCTIEKFQNLRNKIMRTWIRASVSPVDWANSSRVYTSG